MILDAGVAEGFRAGGKMGEPVTCDWVPCGKRVILEPTTYVLKNT